MFREGQNWVESFAKENLCSFFKFNIWKLIINLESEIMIFCINIVNIV